MGSRAHGTWAKLYADVWVHTKTATLARALEALGVPPRWSRDVAVGQLHRLACGLADLTDDGAVGHLAPQEFCSLIGWTDHRNADSVLAAWLSSGFIDNPGAPGATLHGFDEFFGELIRKRANKQAQRERQTGGDMAVTWRRRSPPKTVTVTDVSPHKSESESEQLPSVAPPNPPVPDRPAHGGAEEVADAWAAACPDLEQPTRPLARGIRAKLQAAWKRETGRDWPATFAEVAASEFLSGRAPGRNGGEPFRAAITWCTGPENLAKIDAGQYRSGRASVAAPSKTAALYRDAAAILERSRREQHPDHSTTNHLPA